MVRRALVVFWPIVPSIVGLSLAISIFGVFSGKPPRVISGRNIVWAVLLFFFLIIGLLVFINRTLAGLAPQKVETS